MYIYSILKIGSAEMVVVCYNLSIYIYIYARYNHAT